MSSSFDILKKIGVLNFEWVEVVRDLQAAETRIQELQVRSPGEYIVFSQHTLQVVGRFNSLMAGAVPPPQRAQRNATLPTRPNVS
jgi:hypothetical protein